MSWEPRLLARRALMIGLALAAGSCTTYGVIENRPLLRGEGERIALEGRIDCAPEMYCVVGDDYIDVAER